MRSIISRRGIVRLLMGISLVAALAACTKETPPTIANLDLKATQNINHDDTGRPSPVVVRVYELTGPIAFSGADFLQMYRQDTTALAADLRSRHEVTLMPGENKTLVLEFKPDSRGIGVMALYRNYETAIWRAYAAVPPAQTTNLTAQVGEKSITLSTGH